MSGIPLLNNYKLEFFWKRFPQTVLGGCKFKLGYPTPPYVKIHQLILFLLPWLLGGFFTILAELDSVREDIALYIYGSLMVVLVIIVQLVSLIIRTDNTVVPIDTIITGKNMVDDEDEIEFRSCCGKETLEFIIPGKKFKFNIILHALLSGPLCALGMWYLQPKTLNTVYNNNITATVIMFILGWITICIAEYSLSVTPPPETAIFRSVDRYELSPLMRPFYVMVLYAIDIMARYHTSFTTANYICHIVFVCLPVLWTIGLLPPLDAFFLWIFEQTLTIFFGGSPMASDIRLFIMLPLSCAAYLLVYFVPRGFQTVILMAAVGYILSVDLGGLAAQIYRSCSKKGKKDNSLNNSGFLWHWQIKECIFHFTMLTLSVGVTAVVYSYCVISRAVDYTNYIGYAIIGVFVLVVVLADVQSVNVFFGLWRNKLYPASVQRNNIFHKGKRFLNVIGYIRRALLDFACPLLMLAYLAMSTDYSTPSSSVTSNSTDSALDVLGTVRAFRWVWQSTQSSLLEMTVLHITKVTLPSDSGWLALSLGSQLLILSFVRDRTSQTLDKLYFYWTTLVTAWTEKKQRLKSTAGVIALNLVLFPLILGVICLSSLLAAPLLPLFTLPVFLIGFPRPVRSWPEEVGASANSCPDSVYYQQAAPRLAGALSTAYARGSIGEPSPGKHYLLRFQDRMAWVQVLERGYSFCTLSIKGLELQETSCHTAEASRVDDIFEAAFEQENEGKCISRNKFLSSTLRPLDAAYVDTLSDAKNQLTGVIDSPEVLKSVATNFKKTLLWVLMKYTFKLNHKNTAKLSSEASKYSHSEQEGDIQMEVTQLRGEMDEQEKYISTKNNAHGKTMEEGAASRVDTPTEGNNNARRDSIKSFTNSLWSDDESLLMESMDVRNKKTVDLLRGIQGRQEPGLDASQDNRPSGLMSVRHAVTSGHRDMLSEDLDEFPDTLGLPAVDVSQRHKPNTLHPLHCGAASTTMNSLCTSYLGSSSSFDTSFSKLLDIPARWLEIPINESHLRSEEKDFSENWLKHVICCLDFDGVGDKGPVEVAMHISHDKTLAKMYSQFTSACSLILNNTDPVSLGASHVYKVYRGDIPWSPAVEWLNADSELLKLAIQAYRYSVKLSIDEMLLGPVSSEEELEEYLTEFDTRWYIGLESDPQWTEAISQGIPQLFSLSYNSSQNTYHSRLLSGQDTSVYIGSLSPEVVRGHWANLNLELFYMTNDDEERYSIQAHPTLLRNLTVQAADPPLGYPIYSSPPVSVPTL